MRYIIPHQSGTPGSGSSQLLVAALLGAALFLLVGAKTAKAAAEMQVQTATGVEITDGGSHDFGSVRFGTNVQRLFSIRNLGNTALNLTGNPRVTITGAHAADFAVIVQPASPVPPGNVTIGNAGFEAPVQGLGGGYTYAPTDGTWSFSQYSGVARNGTVWYGTPAPEGNQAGYLASVGQSISQAITFPGAGSYVILFDAMYAQSDSGTMSVAMDGTTLGTASNDALRKSGWRTLQIPYQCPAAGNHTLSFTMSTGGSVVLDNVRITWSTIAVAFTPRDSGVRTAVLSIPNDDGDENPYNITLMGTCPIVPEIALEQPAGTPLLTGQVIGWGSLNSGQLDGLSELPPVRAITAGSQSTQVLLGDGTVAGVGDFPTLPGISNIVAFESGDRHTIALKADGTVVCWGYNSHGQLNVPAGLSGVVAIAAGAVSCVALKSDGSIVSWGYFVKDPPAGLANVVALSRGTTHTAALKSDGTVVVWGEGFHGETNVPPGLTGVASISAGGYMTHAIKSNGTVVSWGGGYWPPGDLTNVARIAAGHHHALALKTDGSVVAWGANGSGKTSVPPGLRGVRAVEANGPADDWTSGHSLALVDSTVDFNEQLFNTTSAARTFTIRNLGIGSLTVSNLSVIGPNASSFTVSTAGMLGTLPAKTGTTTFAVTFAPGTVGEKHATLRVSNNDPDEGTYYVNLTGTGVFPSEIAVYTGAGSAPGNARTSNVGTNVFANTVVGSSSTVQTFTITNTGQGNLTGLALSKSGANPGDFTLGAFNVASLLPGASATFTVNFAPTAGGGRSAVVNIASNDGDENPFRINVSGTALVVPEIAVFTGAGTNAANALVDNAGTYVYPNTLLTASSLQSFTIKNVGLGILSGLVVTTSGAHPDDFGVGSLFALNLQPQASTTFTVTFAPSGVGVRSAVVNIVSNDGDENPFRINVTGTGITFTQQPSHVTVCAGAPATFQAVIGGSGLTYQWQRRVRGGSTFDNIAGATSSTYTTPAAGAQEDGSAYRLWARNGSQSLISDEAMLSVITLPSSAATYDFDHGLPTNTAIYGDAQVAAKVLELNSNAQGKSGAFLIDSPTPTGPVRGFVATFKVRIVSGNGFADGFSFNWATNLPTGTYAQAEEGEGSGLRVCFDTYNNGASEGPAIDVKWGATTIATYRTDNTFLPGTANDFADVAIRLNPDGTLDMTYRCVSIFTRLPVLGYTALVDARFGLGARTGGSYESHAIDDLSIAVEAAEPILEASVPGDFAMGTSLNSPWFSLAPKAVDNDVTSKYLNFDKLNTGLTITPSGRRPVRALTLISAEDVPDRDPASFVLEGSMDGATFTRIASNAVPVFPARNFIQSFAVANSNVFNQYRVLFPRVVNNARANSMQIAEVELLYNPEITSTNDSVSITLPPGATNVRGVDALFDRELGLVRKLELWSLGTNDAIVDLTPSAGETLLTGFELIGAADDLAYPERRPSSVTVSGSRDGINYTHIATVVPAAPASNLQIQEFSTAANAAGFTRYRITFGPPVGGNVLQVGEMRLFGEIGPVIQPPPALSLQADGSNVIVRWPDAAGFTLEFKTSLTSALWTPVGIAPVLSNGVNTVTLPRNEDAVFFRLRK